VNEEFED